MPLDPRLQVLLDILLKEPKPDRSLPPQERRDLIIAKRAARPVKFSDDGPEMLSETSFEVAGPHGPVPVVAFRPRDGVLPGLIYIHGGGWWQGSVADSAPNTRRRAQSADCVAVSIDYRLAPEYPFPQGLDDCFAVAKWVFDNAEMLGIDPERIAIEGESAGGNLAAGVCLLARDAGGPDIKAQVLHVPGMDLRMQDSESMIEYADSLGMTREDLEECAVFYVGADGDRSHPLVSPVLAELHDLPPALIMTCECDPIRDAGEEFARKLDAAGVPTTWKRWNGLAHGTGELGMVLPEIAPVYTGQVTDFLRAAWTPTTNRVH